MKKKNEKKKRTVFFELTLANPKSQIIALIIPFKVSNSIFDLFSFFIFILGTIIRIQNNNRREKKKRFKISMCNSKSVNHTHS